MHINHRRKNRYHSYLSWRGVETYRWFKQYRNRINRRYVRQQLHEGKEPLRTHPGISSMFWYWID